MTGRELIIFILQNNLEDEVVIKNGVFIGFMDENEAAAKFSVGPATIKAWHARGLLHGFKVNNTLYFFKTEEDPRNRMKITLF